MRVHLNNGVTSVKQRSLRVHGSSLGPNHDSGENGKQRKIYISKIAELHFFSAWYTPRKCRRTAGQNREENL